MTELKIEKIDSEIKLRERIAIIGTGNYGIAIAKRLLEYGYEVIFGSRQPNFSYLNECLNPTADQTFSVTTQRDAFLKSDKLVFIAISSNDDVYEGLADELFRSDKKQEFFKGSKILIELSNSSDKFTINKTEISNAEKLELMIRKNNPHNSIRVNVVKAFNLISAYTMAINYEEQKGNIETIPIAGDDLESKNYVIKFSNSIGFQAVDIGPLKNSLKLELANLKTFDEWFYPTIGSFLFVIFNFFFIMTMYYLFPKKPHTLKQYLAKFSILGIFNKALGFSSLQLLALVYFGSAMASMYQLKYSTKYKRFPKYLDTWLKQRKQIGLLAFLIASIHAVSSVIITCPAYLESWYRDLDKPNKFNVTKMTINGELNIMTGYLAYFIMLLVALSSINSIANSFNWSEWRFVQTKLGISCLTMGLIHSFFMYLNIFLDKDKYNYNLVYLLTRVKLISMIFPACVLLLRFLFSNMKPFSTKLKAIRNGTYYSTSYSKELAKV